LDPDRALVQRLPDREWDDAGTFACSPRLHYRWTAALKAAT
jgi:hypothetical protein